VAGDKIPMKRLMTEKRLILDDFGPSDQVFDLMADRLADGPTGLAAQGFDHSASVSTPRWHCVIIPEHFVHVDVSKRSHRVKYKRKDTH
jgi:hypothetical protein